MTVNKTYDEINEKIKQRKAVVVTAEEMIGIVKDKGAKAAAKQVDVVTTGTFGPMCSSGAVLNVGHTAPRIKIQRAWLNGVAAYGGLAAVDLYIGATELAKNALRDDFRRHERDQPGPLKQIGIERGQIGRICDRCDREVRIVPAQHRGHGDLLGLTRKQNDRVEHRLPVCVGWRSGLVIDQKRRERRAAVARIGDAGRVVG